MRQSRLDAAHRLFIVVALVASLTSTSRVSATMYTWQINVNEPMVCSNVPNTACGGSAIAWGMPENAQALDATWSPITLNPAECSMVLRCQDFSNELPVFSSSWSNALTASFDINMYYSSTQEFSASPAIVLPDGQASAFRGNQVIPPDPGGHLHPTGSAPYTPIVVPDLREPTFGVEFFAEDISISNDISIDVLNVQISFGGDAFITGPSSIYAAAGELITLTGTFFDSRDLAVDPLCVFDPPSAPRITNNAISVSGAAVQCLVPDMGADMEDVLVTVQLDPGLDISPGTTLLYNQMPAPPPDPDPDDDAKKDSPVPVLFRDLNTTTVLALSGATGLVVLGVGVAAVMLRRSSARDSMHKLPERADLDVSPPIASSAAPSVASAVSAESAAMPPRRRASSKTNARRPSKRSEHRASLDTDAPGMTYESTPISEFGPRSSMRTEFSVTSEQAPFFVADRNNDHRYG